MNKLNESAAVILTLTNDDNYGQKLQNLAVKELLKKHFKTVYTFTKKISIRERLRLLKFFIKNHKSRELIRSINFWSFNNKHLNYKPFVYKKNQYYFIGSDQVFSPYFGLDLKHINNFINKDQTILLCASIGVEDIPQEKKLELKNFLNQINFLSVREYSASNIISECTNKQVETLIDPTLMFGKDFWNTICNNCKIKLPKKYAFLYFLGPNDVIEKIKEICFKQNLEIIDITKGNFFTLDPSYFVYLIKNSSLVFTDSYHGTIFSIIYNIPFVMCNRKECINMSTRFETLTSKLNIIGRFLNEVDQKNIFNINFEIINKNIKKEQIIFENYLNDSLKMIKK